MSKGELAKAIFSTGANCSQSVMLAFKDELGLDETVVKKLSVGLGGGVARQRMVCGAVSAMVTILGYLKTDGNDKLTAYKIGQAACARFKEKVGSLICSELLDGKVDFDTSPNPEERTEHYYKKRPCQEICSIAAEIAEELLNNK